VQTVSRKFGESGSLDSSIHYSAMLLKTGRFLLKSLSAVRSFSKLQDVFIKTAAGEENVEPKRKFESHDVLGRVIIVIVVCLRCLVFSLLEMLGNSITFSICETIIQWILLKWLNHQNMSVFPSQ
jgi:hypothetical protein